MELTIVDVSEIPGVHVGDEVVLLRKQGSEEITRRGDGRIDRKHPLRGPLRHRKEGPAGLSAERRVVEKIFPRVFQEPVCSAFSTLSASEF